MIDFLRLSIPFKAEDIIVCKDGETSFLKDSLIEIARRTGIKLKSSNVTFEIDGDLDVQELSHPYESIPSHFSSIAMKVFNGSDLMNKPPYVELKASPAKLLQGHNVFGSTDLETCSVEMINSFIKAMPELYEMLDVEETSVDWIDVTYSAHIDSESVQKQLISFLIVHSCFKMKHFSAESNRLDWSYLFFISSHFFKNGLLFRISFI